MSSTSSLPENGGYQYQWLNYLEQFGYVSYDLLITDINHVMPDIRLMKEFKSGAETNLDAIGETECMNAYQVYQNTLTRQWAINQIQYASGLVANYIQSADPDLDTLMNVDAIINPVMQFYGLQPSIGLQPLLLNRLNNNTDEIIKAFNQLPITDNTVPATQYFVEQVKKALGCNRENLLHR